MSYSRRQINTVSKSHRMKGIYRRITNAILDSRQPLCSNPNPPPSWNEDLVGARRCAGYHQRGAAIMPEGALPFQYAEEKSSTGMTAMAGLGAYLDMMYLWESVRRHVVMKRGGQGWTDSQMITSLLLLNVVGGESVDDLDVLEGDEGLGGCWGEWRLTVCVAVSEKR